jgi:uncharacterized protein
MTTADRSLASSTPQVTIATASSSTMSATTTSPQEDLPAVAPVREEERISAIDTIRGFALLGILLMNITGFGLPQAAYSNPIPAGGATGWNLFLWSVMNVFADGKMRAIFSLTFGASVCLLVDRLSRKGAAADAADIHYRRMLWLMLFGMIHAYLIWLGDILFWYALAGLLLYPLRKLSPRALLVTAGILMLALSANGYRNYVQIKNEHSAYVQIQADEKAGKKLTEEQEGAKKEWEQTLKDTFPSPADLKKETDAHLGSYYKLLLFRANAVYPIHSHPIYDPFWYDPLAMMLIGMALLKLGVLTGNYSKKFYLCMALVSFAVGIPSDTWSAWYPIKHHFAIEAWYLTGVEYQFGRFTAFGYLALLLLVIKSGVLQPVTRTLASVGRMAFSNYILTSLICTTVFEGYGFGLFGKLQRYQLYEIIPLVWAVNLMISPIWLRHFRFGPLEWAWRCLTYWKIQPFRIQHSA